MLLGEWGKIGNLRLGIKINGSSARDEISENNFLSKAVESTDSKNFIIYCFLASVVIEEILQDVLKF